jgi:probable F420-dependent oxidoreductase
MKYGIVFPQYEFPTDIAAMRDFTQTAEGLGFDHILAYDHVLGVNPDREGGWSGPYTYKNAFEEPLTFFSYLAGITTSLQFITGIIILPQRQTALFAKQAATLDVLSNGRLRLGVALGWNEVEYISLNEPFHQRGARFEEQIKVLRLLWTQPLVNFEGKWHHIPDAGINPLPVQRPIPLWLGGHADPVLRRVARLADGWLPNYRTVEEAKDGIAKLKQYLQEAGRSMADIGMEPRIRYDDGDPEIWRKRVEEWEAVDATHLTVMTMGAGFRTAKEHIRAMERYAEALEIKPDR